ncbi:hypothetical protein GGI03_008387, partial [Coemansia sp. RSA 2337]
MVLLTHQDTQHTRFNDNSSSSNGSHGRAALVALEQADILDITAALQKAASFDAGRQATASASHLSSRRASGAAVTDTDTGLDDAPFIVSGPLLPIRQARRGINPNRNYRIFGTPPFVAADIHPQQQQQHRHPDPIDAMFAPPTPVSASVSSASYSSRAGAERGSRLGSGSSGASNKSSASSASAGNSVSDTLSTLEDILAERGRQIRVYDKHQMRGISELAMEPV